MRPKVGIAVVFLTPAQSDVCPSGRQRKKQDKEGPHPWLSLGLATPGKLRRDSVTSQRGGPLPLLTRSHRNLCFTHLATTLSRVLGLASSSLKGSECRVEDLRRSLEAAPELDR